MADYFTKHRPPSHHENAWLHYVLTLTQSIIAEALREDVLIEGQETDVCPKIGFSTREPNATEQSSHVSRTGSRLVNGPPTSNCH